MLRFIHDKEEYVVIKQLLVINSYSYKKRESHFSILN